MTLLTIIVCWKLMFELALLDALIKELQWLVSAMLVVSSPIVIVSTVQLIRDTARADK